MSPLFAYVLRLGWRPTDPEVLRKAAAATRAAWDESRRNARGTASAA